MPALASNTQVHGSPIKSDETTSSSVYPMMPFIGPSEAAFRVALISSYLAGLANRQVKSTTETLAVGTRNAIPVHLPLSSGLPCLRPWLAGARGNDIRCGGAPATPILL